MKLSRVIDEHPARELRKNYLLKLDKSGRKNFYQLHQDLFALNENSVVENYKRAIALFQTDALKKALIRISPTADYFSVLRSQVIKSYSCLSAGSYILGIGDRHLENFLIEYRSGGIYAIDFGYSFGIGVTLAVPELTPFRFTPIFEELCYPLSVEGVFRNSMICAMSALRKGKDVILETSEVFVKVNYFFLLEWLHLEVVFLSRILC